MSQVIVIKCSLLEARFSTVGWQLGLNTVHSKLTNLVGLSHVAEEEPPHTFDSTLFQLVGTPPVIPHLPITQISKGTRYVGHNRK